MNILESIITLRRMITITDYTYLYEIIEDYKNAETTYEKETICKNFFSLIRSCCNERRVYTKTIKYSVKKNLLNTDVGRVFNMWSEIEYTGYKSITDKTDWTSIIRQKINNIYTRYFDKEVIIKKDYMELLRTPKRLYYRWLHGCNMDASELTDIIDTALYNAEQLKLTYQKQKMNLSWDEYLIVIEEILKKALGNCRIYSEFEDSDYLPSMYDFFNEDRVYISYFCKYLETEILQWQKKYYNVRSHKKYKRCVMCGALIEITGRNTKYCAECRQKARLESKRNWWNSHR